MYIYELGKLFVFVYFYDFVNLWVPFIILFYAFIHLYLLTVVC
jgi:hypothetical protein